MESGKRLTIRGEQWYKWRNGVLIQHKLLDWEHFGDVLVVPKSHRERILKVAHEYREITLAVKRCWLWLRKDFSGQEWPNKSHNTVRVVQPVNFITNTHQGKLH